MNKTIIGLQWGDEGKGKICDILAADADIVVRFNGGVNAGHTVIVEGKKYVFHIIPSGILYPQVSCLIGPGTVIDPEIFIKEVKTLHSENISTTNLRVSPLIHLITPEHKLRDAENEKGDKPIGTTKKGIGPCYSDKMARKGIRIIDLFTQMDKIKPLFSAEFIEVLKNFKDIVGSFLADSQKLLLNSLNKCDIIFEGAQGLMLDIDHGTYPYVTSSTTHPANAASSNGIPIDALGEIIGVSKAYTTRVGGGPFPTELKDETGDLLRKAGNEFGSTTGRPRRCGWLDLPQLKYATRMAGVDRIILTKLDILCALTDELRVCIAYDEAEQSAHFGTNLGINWEKADPVYVNLDPIPEQKWEQVHKWEQLSEEAQRYIRLIEAYIDIPVSHVSVGPGRESLIEIPH